MSLDGSNVEGWKDAPSLGSGAGGRLGMVVSGSLTEGVQVKLDPDSSVEAVKVGTFVTLQGERMRFFGVVTDVSLGSTDATLSASPPDVSDPYVAQVISGTAAYGALTVEPMLTIAGDDPEVLLEGPQPAKTVPPHFAEAAAANEQDIERVFGAEDEGHFWIGSPLDMDTKLCLDVPELVMRSNGVFGKSGTGKTFLTRLLLAGILQSGAAVNLVFDMESEYGWRGYSEAGSEVKGLKQLFHSQVAVFSLDEASSKRRGLTPDYVVRIGYDEVEPDDIVLLRETLDLSEVAADAAHSLRGYYGKGWLSEFLGVSGREGITDLADATGVNVNALWSLKNRMHRLERLGFMEEKGQGAVEHILRYLDRGMHVVLEFGRYGRNLAAYILVANLLTRRIYERYAERKELASDDRSKEPRPLVITIEEAHKFLTPGGGVADDIRDHRPGDAEVQRDSAGGGPEAKRDRRGGDEPVGHEDHVPAGQRARHRRGPDRSVGEPQAAGGAGAAGVEAAGAGVRTRRADARGGEDARVRLGGVVQVAGLAGRRGDEGPDGARRRGPVRVLGVGIIAPRSSSCSSSSRATLSR